jgi:hypothetical protein
MRQSGRGRKRKRAKVVAPRTADEFFSQPRSSQHKWEKVVHVVSKVRAGSSLSKASKEYRISPRTVRRLAGPALRKRPNGRYAAAKRDRLLRVLVVPTSEGLREVALRDSRQTTVLAQYWIAGHRYLQTGDSVQLETFNGQHITAADGAVIPLLTSTADLDRLANAGVLSFESIYRK